MKYLVVLMMLITSLPAKPPVTPEPIVSFTVVNRDARWYIKQAGAWQQVIEKEPHNADAWYNYYSAVRYAWIKRSDRAKEAGLAPYKDVLAEMEKAVPGTFELHYLKGSDGIDPRIMDEQLADLEKAHALKPDDPRPLDNLAVQYEIQHKPDKFREICHKLYEHRLYSQALLDYNYNVIIGLDSNAVLFTNGDNDTYPLWMLQQVKKVRPDVIVLNYNLCYILSYLIPRLKEARLKADVSRMKRFDCPTLVKAITEQDPDRPVYFASTISRQRLKPFEANLYLIGLANQYSTDRIDNIAILKRNLEKLYRLDYLKHDWYGPIDTSPHITSYQNQNYIPALLVLQEHYKKAESPEKVQEIQTLIGLVSKKKN